MIGGKKAGKFKHYQYNKASLLFKWVISKHF